MTDAAPIEPGVGHPAEDQAPARPGRRAGSAVLAAAGLALCLLPAVATYRSLYRSGREAVRRADGQRLEYFAESLGYAVEKNEHLPFLIGLERDVVGLLLHPGEPKRVEDVNRYLALVQSKAAVAAAYLLDGQGLTLASSNASTPSSFVGHSYAYRPYFREAVAGRPARFYGVGVTTGDPGYFLSAPVRHGDQLLGAVVVKVNLDGVEQAWRRSGERLLLVDENGVAFLASVPAWKYSVLWPISAAALERIAETRQYGKHTLVPFLAGNPVRLSDGAQTLRLGAGQPAAEGAPESREVLIQSRASGPIGWRLVMVSDLHAVQTSALGGAGAVGFGAAFALTAALSVWLRRSRLRERRQANARLQRAYEQLERRIGERTRELVAANEHLAERVEALKGTERILRETQDSAVQAGKLAVLGQMAAGITHELNQPLAALTTLQDNAARLMELGRVEEARENLRRVSQLTRKMGGIVGELKAFARKAPAAPSPVVVADAVAHAVLLVEPQRRRAQVAIEVRESDATARAVADSIRVEQVLVNLMRNGIEAMEEGAGRLLEVSVSRAAGRVRIAVRDHGPGIAGVRDRLFEPFFTTKAPGVGLGLGLAISRTIAQGMGGELVAGDAPGGGAEFLLVLPEAPPEVLPEAP
jgi:two-component system C4-dicarboxylate transport sensor histidine kinase DctB